MSLFAFSEEWNTVYLASFPRSGNHWVRFLTEEATHIATSSVYRDHNPLHLRTRFPWGGYCPDHGYEGNRRYPTENDPVFIKTHYPLYRNTLSAEPQRSVCLIRHPIDSFYSLHVFREKREKIQLLRQKRQEIQLSNITQIEIDYFIKDWRKFYEYWEKQPNVLIIRYEDLLNNLEYELSRILEHAGYPFDQADIARAAKAYPPEGKLFKHIHQFESQQIQTIKEKLSDLLEKYGYDL